MRRHRPFIVHCLLWVTAGAAMAAGPAERDLSLTIYNNDLALVQDHRAIDLTGGRQRIEFQSVSAQIRPETVSLAAADVSIVEQNFDFDLLSPGKLMEKAVGSQITLVRVNPATNVETRERAQVLATNGGVVLKIGDRIEVLRDDGLPVRVIFDKVPDNLRARPTLSITVNGSKSGSHPATLSYLTPGLGWHADYVALFDEASSKIDVQGWVTLTNTSGATYDDARTLLVAGSPNQVTSNGYSGYSIRNQRRPAGTMVTAGTESGDRERLGDFYLYPLSERTTIADQQTKQVGFLDVHAVPAEHGYEFRNGWLGSSETPVSAKSVYRFSTGSHAGLGDQLPAGVLRFYMRDQRGAPQFIGETQIGHTPMGSTLALATGDAFDVKVKTTIVKRTALGLNKWRSDMHYELTNALPTAVTVTLIQSGLYGDTRVVSDSAKSGRIDADSAQWSVHVPANGSADVQASFESRF